MARRKKQLTDPAALAVAPEPLPLADGVDAPDDRRSFRLIAAVIVVAVLLVFGRAVFFEFVNWDDNDNLYANTHYQPATWSSLWQFWTTPYKQFYLPVTYTVWWVLAQQAQLSVPDELNRYLNPFVFHATNILLHAANAVLAWRLLDKLFANRWAAAMGALAWALHPLKAEPVAWCTGMKDVLSGTFALASLLAFVTYAGDERGGRRAVGTLLLAVVLFALALLSKTTMVVVLPLAGLLAWWRHPATWRRVLVGLVPMALIAVPVVLMTIAIQSVSGAQYTYPAWQRPIVALDTMAFYLIKTAWPGGLATLYMRSPNRLFMGDAWYWTWIIPAAVATVAILLRRLACWAPLAMGVFVLGILPASGLQPFNYQNLSTPADRYMYIPLLGLGIAVAGLLATPRPSTRHGVVPRVTWAAAVLWVGVLSALCWSQVGTWRSSETMYRQVIAVEPSSLFARFALAQTLEHEGRPEEALVEHRYIAQAAPTSIVAHVGVARVNLLLGNEAEAKQASARAIAVYLENPERLMDLNPGDRVNFGAHLQSIGRIDDLVMPLVPSLAPNDVKRRVAVAEVLAGAGRATEAMALLEEARRLSPNDPHLIEAMEYVPQFLDPGKPTLK